ncbi:MAG TPA: phosphoglycerate dehydrogenase [Chroococcales cyanobacterium]
MPKLLVADEMSQEGLDQLQPSVAVTYAPAITPQELLETIGDYEGILVRSRTKVTAEVIKRGVKLKAIGRAGVGVDNIDVQAATEAGILVLNSPEGNTASAAEHAIALMFALARKVPAADASMKTGKWERNKFLGCELFNKTLGIVGLGKVGGRVAKTAQALGMKVIVFDPMIAPEKAASLNLRLVPLEEIWQKSDFISIHTPKTRETTNLINGTVLSRVKPGVRIINASRGGIIDEAALAAAIKDGRVAGAALDVFDQEPPQQSPLFELGDKVVLTPHLGASTVEAQYNVSIDLAEQMRDYLSQGILKSPVNLPFMRQEVLQSLGKYFSLAESMGAIIGELCESPIKEIEILAYGSLAGKETTPLTVAALRGILSGKIRAVTYVNSQIIARNNGIEVRESKFDRSEQYRDELSIIISTESGICSISGTVLAHNEAIITRINEHPINLTPQRYMLFTAHQDKPGMVAKVADALGQHDVNISTMSVGRKGIREQSIMVMALDDPIPDSLIHDLSKLEGIRLAKFVSLPQ